MATCSLCWAEIEWFKTERGRPMPVDPAPHPDGNLRLDYDTGTASVVKKGSEPGLHMSHFATCVSAAKFRKPRENKGQTG